MTSYPLMQGFAPQDVFAWRGGHAITAAAFLAEAMALADALPQATHVINLCASRIDFTLGFAAAMLRGQITLLPPNDTQGTLAQLAEDYPGAYCLTDDQVSGIRDQKSKNLNLIPGPCFPIPEFPAGQVAALLFTSGSTGRPKPQTRTWGAFVRSTRAAGRRLDIAGLHGATLVGTVPHQHSYGIESTVLLALQHGLALQDTRPLLPADIAAALAAVPGKRILVTAPIHLKALLADGLALPKTDLVLSATAPLSPQLAKQAELALGGPLQEIYGCSEAGQLATRRTAETEQWHCFDGITLRQQDGITFAQGDAVGDETQLNDVIELADSTKFLLHGRMADLVNIAGKRSSLAHLTHHLNAIPGVVDGAFVMPEGDAARVMAFVVAPGLDATSIMAALRRHIDPAFLPRPLCLVDRLPRNQLGKLPREAAESLMASTR